MPQVLSGGNYFVNLQRSVRKGDMEIMESVLGVRVRNIGLIKKGLRFVTE